jgi:anti-anti-sigma regulatory factor
MLKISIIENERKRQVILEGRLIAPWTDELKSVLYRTACDLDHRELVIDLRGVIAISSDGQGVLLALMNQGVRFRTSGVFMRQVLKELSRRSRLAKGIKGEFDGSRRSPFD